MNVKFLSVLIMCFLTLPLVAGKCIPGKCGPGPRGGSHGGGGIMMMLPELDLTDEQIQEVAEITKTQKETDKTIHKQLAELHAKNFELAFADSLDDDAVAGNAQKIADLMTEMMIAKTKVMHEIISVLTSEQRATLKSKMAEQKKKMEKRREKMEKFREAMQDSKENN